MMITYSVYYFPVYSWFIPHSLNHELFSLWGFNCQCSTRVPQALAGSLLQNFWWDMMTWSFGKWAAMSALQPLSLNPPGLDFSEDLIFHHITLWYDAVPHQSISLPDSAEADSLLLQTKPLGLEIRHLENKKAPFKTICEKHGWKIFCST